MISCLTYEMNIPPDTGADKKSICLSSGAEHFIDFKELTALNSESSNGPVTPVAQEIIKVCGGVGAHAAVVVSPSVSSLAVNTEGTGSNESIFLSVIPCPDHSRVRITKLCGIFVQEGHS